MDEVMPSEPHLIRRRLLGIEQDLARNERQYLAEKQRLETDRRLLLRARDLNESGSVSPARAGS